MFSMVVFTLRFFFFTKNVTVVLFLFYSIIRCELLCRSVWCYANFGSVIRVSSNVHQKT